jgi:hypothetical protein
MSALFISATDEQHMTFRQVTQRHGFKTEPASGEDGGRVLPVAIDVPASGPIEAENAAERLYWQCATEVGLERDPLSPFQRRAMIVQ